MHNFFWGTVSLAMLGVLVGLLILMLTEDVKEHWSNGVIEGDRG